MFLVLKTIGLICEKESKRGSYQKKEENSNLVFLKKKN